MLRPLVSISAFQKPHSNLGIAVLLFLRQSEDGTVNLDNPRRRKRLGVAVTRDNKTTGVFHFRTTQKDQTANIDQQITEARDSLFEEELFYEISREARSIANQGITTRGQHIEIALDAHSKLSLLFGEEHEGDDSMSPKTIDGRIRWDLVAPVAECNA